MPPQATTLCSPSPYSQSLPNSASPAGVQTFISPYPKALAAWSHKRIFLEKIFC